METQEIYLSTEQAQEISEKLEAHIDDLLADIRIQIVDHLSEIVTSYLKINIDDEKFDILHTVQPTTT